MVQHENTEEAVVPSAVIQLFGREFRYVEGIPVGRVVQFLGRIRFEKDGCWEWLGGRQINGYGAFHWGGRNIPAHRFSWIAFRGIIEPGAHIHHVCKNPSCVNPEHLQPLTPAAHLLEHTPNNPVYVQSRIEICKRGHPLQGRNLREWVDPKNGQRHRRCKTCLREWAAARWAALRARRESGPRTHCGNGHELTPENTYEWCGSRQCKICHNTISAKSYAKRNPPKPPKPPKTHCVNGHPWIEENLYRTGKDKQVVVCYLCHKEGQRKSYEKRKAKYGKFWKEAG